MSRYGKKHKRQVTLINDDRYLNHPFEKQWKDPEVDSIDLVFASSPPSDKGNLFLTSIAALKGQSGLYAIRSRNITQIVSMGVDCAEEQPSLKDIVLFVDIADTVDAMGDLDKHLERAYQCIADEMNNENGGSVLVHCRQGISRSASVVCYYLMKTYQITAIMALARVKKSRSKANPNQGFFKILQQRDPKEL